MYIAFYWLEYPVYIISNKKVFSLFYLPIYKSLFYLQTAYSSLLLLLLLKKSF